MAWRPLPDPDGEPPTPISDSLDRVLRALGSPPVATRDELDTVWPEVVGPAIAGTCRPVSLTAGTLTVVVPDGGWASQLRWMSPELVAKFEGRLGPGVVDRIETRVRRD